MESLTAKTFTTRTLTYHYHDTGPTPSSKPALLLLHGFPDTSTLWSGILPHLLPLGHRIIAPTLPGHGASPAPADPTQLHSRALSADLAALLASIDVPRVVVIGHDWGSFHATRLWMWEPQLVAGVGMLNVHYIPPAAFDLAETNTAIEKATGAPRFAYWEYFAQDPGAPAAIEKNLDSFWSVMHAAEPGIMAKVWSAYGGMKGFVESDTRAPLLPYAEPGKGLKEEWFAWVRERGIEGALGWYKAMVEGAQWEVEKELPAERLPITVPSFYLGCTGDGVCLPGFVAVSKEAGLVPRLEEKVIESAHWCLYEKPQEVGEAIKGWLEGNF